MTYQQVEDMQKINWKQLTKEGPHSLTSVARSTDAGVAALPPHAGAVVATGTTVAQVYLCVTYVVLPHAGEALQANTHKHIPLLSILPGS